MAAGDLLPAGEHVARYCKNTQVESGQASGAAFVLEGTHLELSATWIEHISAAGTRGEQLRAVVQALNASGFTTKKTGWLAVLRTDRISTLTELAGTALQLSVRHAPELGNPGHSGVYGLPPPNTPLAAAVGLELSRRVAEPATQVRSL